MSESNSIRNLFDQIYDQTPKEKMMDLYTKWANTYEEETVYKENGYKGFILLAKVIDLFATDKSVEILDIAAGTGLVGNELKQLGYFHVDGLDPCEAMLDRAKERHFYRNYFYQFPAEENAEDSKHGKYDLVSIAGGFSKNHMNYKDIIKLVKYAKINGYILMVFRYEAISSYQLEVPLEIKRLENEGIIEVIMDNEIPKYYTASSGYLAIVRRKL